MKVIGTAGHIDHGKSTLVKRLTGIDPDRLAEEKARGMTIDLGFAWLTLPSGEEVSIVDVPGHERFVKNMLAGAGGIDMALLVIAADEGVMPQTREHVDILDLLGIRAATIALTKLDLVDEEWLALVTDDVERLLDGTSLAGAPIVAVSSETGAGLPKLLQAIDGMVGSLGSRNGYSPPYLPIDRVFTIAGFGTVVTGTLHGGALRTGQEVEVLPARRRGRIRSMQTHRSQVTAAEAGSRLALNLTPLSRSELRRGDTVVLPGSIRAVRRFDAFMRVLSDAPLGIEHGTRASLHIGAAERNATLSLLEFDRLEPGSSGWVQIRLDDAVAAVRGQRFIVRLPSPARTVAGGEVIDVAPRHRRKDRSAITRLEALKSGQPVDLAIGVLLDGRPRTLQQIAEIIGAEISTTDPALRDAIERRKVVLRGGSYLGMDAWQRLSAEAAISIQTYHREHPLRRGIPKEELRSRLGILRHDWPATLALLLAGGILRDEGPVVADPQHVGGSAARLGEANLVLQVLLATPFAPPSGDELLTRSNSDPELLSALVDEGTIVRVDAGLFFARGAYEEMVTLTLSLIDSEGSVTVATLRDRLGTSRKYALAFLGHLDAERVTKRQGDARVVGSTRPACT